MQTMNGKIAAATETELKEFYTRNGYADIITFAGFLEYCTVNGTIIIAAQEDETDTPRTNRERRDNQ